MLDYLGTAYAVSATLEIDKEEAQKYIDKYFEGFHGLKKYDDAVINLAHKQGYLTSLSGHKRHLKKINSKDTRIRSAMERVAVNFMSQGSAAGLLQFVHIDVDRDELFKSLGVKCLFSVYDEIVIEAPKKYANLASEHLGYLMETAFLRRGLKLTYPLKTDGDIGRTYHDAK